jgi:phage baseplate assembly protein W
MLQDIRDSSRLLRREPGSTLAAVLLMALGIAATTTMVSVVKLPAHEPRVVESCRNLSW